WPVMGEDYDKNGIGEPVTTFKKPNVGKKYSVSVPQTNDEFSENKLGLQWQWQSNFSNDWISLTAKKGWLRFYSQAYLKNSKNIYMASALLMQKFLVPSFEAITKVELNSSIVDANAGIIIFGYDYARVGIKKTLDGYKVFQSVCKNAEKGTEEKYISENDVSSSKVFLKASVTEFLSEQEIPIAKCTFSFSEDGKSFQQIGNEFIAKEGKWVGAKIGLFSESANPAISSFADFDWFRFK
ncbi:MAG: glycoside hydrolase, partial [Ignavibacteria bacterium]|nr:glycoside hydrolase [Ignavibacteria bacterium]